MTDWLSGIPAGVSHGCDALGKDQAATLTSLTQLRQGYLANNFPLTIYLPIYTPYTILVLISVRFKALGDRI